MSDARVQRFHWLLKVIVFVKLLHIYIAQEFPEPLMPMYKTLIDFVVKRCCYCHIYLLGFFWRKTQRSPIRRFMERRWIVHERVIPLRDRGAYPYILVSISKGTCSIKGFHSLLWHPVHWTNVVHGWGASRSRGCFTELQELRGSFPNRNFH